MRFLRYQKVYESTGAYAAPKVITARLSDCKSDEWLVQEKVHGSNFSVYCDGHHDRVRYAKRNGFLDPGRDCFYEFQQLDDDLALATRRLWDHLLAGSFLAELWRDLKLGNDSSHGFQVEQLTVYGELFGGYLPSTEEAEEGWEGVFQGRRHRGRGCLRGGPVQEGVYYTDKLSFLVFDVAVLLSEAGANSPETPVFLIFLPYTEVKALGGSAGLRVSAELLRTKRYEEASNFDVSTLVSPLALELNRDERDQSLRRFLEHDNLAEGVVVRPAGASVFRLSGHSTAGQQALDVPPRLLLKRKHARFAEEIENCGGSVTTRVSEFRTRVARLVNRNRLEAVLSKDLGRPLAASVDDGLVDEWRQQAEEQLAEDVWEAFWERGWDLGRVDYDEADSFIREECGRVVAACLGNRG